MSAIRSVSSRLLKICINDIIKDHRDSKSVLFKIILDSVKSILRVFLNLTHDNGTSGFNSVHLILILTYSKVLRVLQICLEISCRQ